MTYGEGGDRPQRALHEVLEAQCQMLAEMLIELRRSNSVAREGAISSVAIEDMAKGPPKITTKMYQGSPLSGEDVDMALAWHGYAHAEAERRALDGWKQTVDELHERAMADVSP